MDGEELLLAGWSVSAIGVPIPIRMLLGIRRPLLWSHGVCPGCSLARTPWALAFCWDTAFVKLGTVEYCETVARHCAWVPMSTWAPVPFLLTSGPGALPHVGFAHVGAGRIVRVFVRDGCFISDEMAERSAL